MLIIKNAYATFSHTENKYEDKFNRIILGCNSRKKSVDF